MSRFEFAIGPYTAIRDRILAQERSIDEETLADTLAGLTDLHEIVAALIRSALCDEMLAVGLKKRIKEMQRRLDRFEDRASKRRQIARDVMQSTGIKTITAPDFTVSLQRSAPLLAVIDESSIPTAYWKIRQPRLDYQALLADLERGDEISGVRLSEVQNILSVRTR